MKKLLLASLFASGILTMGAGLPSSGASAKSCGALWYERNAIYDRRGYCFRTKRARRVFDNSDCWTRNPRLRPWERRRVRQIRRQERRKGCR